MWVTSVLTAAAVVLVLLNPGVATHEVDLHDGGVWVTNAGMRLVAHLNYPSQALDSGFRAGSASFDVDQAAADVFVSDTESDTYTQVDVARSELLTASSATGSARMELGGGSVGVAAPDSGQVWVMPASRYASFDPASSSPLVTDMPGAVLAMGTDGSVHVASTQTGTLRTLTPAGSTYDVTQTDLPALGPEAVLEVSAVGSATAVLDTTSGTLVLPGGRTVTLPGDSWRLQIPGPAAGEVLVSTSQALLRVSLEGEVTTVAPTLAGGTPARPAQHAGCAYAAWGGKGSFLRDCEGSQDDVDMAVAGLDDATRAVFRVNREVIVLNDVESGGLWLPDRNMVQVDNWDAVNSDVEKEETSDEDSTRTQDEAQQERKEENTPPDAVDDSFGVRPGRTAYLPVVANDTDPDGDVLVATPDADPSFATVGKVRGGAALQAQVQEQATGESTFTYTLDDGQDTDQATVTLTVHPFSVNDGPTQLRTSTLALTSGAQVSLNVSGDWIDPDGDPVYLKGVAFPADLDVTWRADGTINVRDLGSATGTTDLTVTYSDGTAETDGVLRVDVRGNDNVPPVANGDHVITPAGVGVQVMPLLNDTDANGDTLRLVSVGQAPAGVGVSVDQNLGMVTVTPSAPGTTYLTYTVSDGPSSTDGLIRVDAVDPAVSLPPVAMDDVTTLPAGGQALVAVLDNDMDPNGGVLSVQSVRTPEGSPLVAALLQHHLLRVTAPSGLSAPAQVTYTVANAYGTTEGHVMVIPVPAASASAPPELTDDTLVVRAGDIGTVSVLANDRSPAGLTMSVSGDLQHEIAPAMGTPFTSGNQVRFRAGDQPGSGNMIYTVRDTAGNVASAVVRVTVVAMDEERNTPPHPKDVTAWAVAGETVTIPVPLEGIDSEGDSVTLVGLGTSPRLGAVELGTAEMAYTAAPNKVGTDVFTYTVRDRLGKIATAQVRVGVAPAATSNQRPVAVADAVTVRPDVAVAVPVLANDVDPDGDSLSLVESLIASQDPAVAPAARGSRVALRSPTTPGTYTMEYGVTDGRSDPVTGLLTLTVSPTAPLSAPVARDDEVPADQVRAGAWVPVDVLANDEDPDGDVAADTISSADDGVRVQDGKLVVEVRDQQRFVLYTLTDPDGLTSSAVVNVPGTTVTVPRLDATKGAVTVRAGTTVTIPLGDYVLAAPGKKVQITDPDKVSAAVGWDGSSLVKDATTLTFGAAADYSGPSSVTFEVTDGADLNDPAGNVVPLTLPITVTPGENRPPVVTPTGVEVAAGETSPAVSMAQWVTDPDGEDPASMTYTLSDVPAGVSASASGSSLSVGVSADAPRGSAGSMTLTVTDAGGASTSASVPVSVVGSTRPLIQLSAASVTTDAGRPVSVDVSSYASNPFPDTPLHLVGTPTSSDGGTVSVSGTTLSITPPSGTNGTATVSYRVGDKTDDPTREVEGVVTVTVRDRPGAPTAVSATSNSPATALVSWTAGPANGADVTGFTLYDDTQGDSTDCGVVTSCLFSGRTNGVDHTFHVVARNAVGDSPASASATTNIDVVPGTVPQAVATPGDRELSVTWSAPSNEGSALKGYTVALSPGGQQQSVTGTSATFTGLTNGSAYTVVVKAENAKGQSQEWSSPSVAVTPFGRPGPVGTVSAEATGLGTASGSDAVRVSWGPVSSTNGKDVEYYTVTSSNGASTTVQGGSRSTTLEGVGTAEDQVSFCVTATNDGANASARTSSQTCVSTWVVGVPASPNASGLAATGSDNQISMTTSAVAGNGWRTSDLSLEWSVGGGAWQSVSNLSGNGLSNGQAATVRVRACGAKTGTQSCSTPTEAGTVTPFGSPVGPTMSCAANGTRVDCSWSGGNGNGRDTSFVLSGHESASVGPSGSRSWDVGEGGYVRLCVKAVQHSSEKGESPTSDSCAEARTRTYARSAGTYKAAGQFGGGSSIGYCAVATCNVVGLRLTDWPPNTTVSCSGKFGGYSVSTSIPVDGAGNASYEGKWNIGVLGADTKYGEAQWANMIDSLSCR